MYNFSFFGQIFFFKHFYYKTVLCDKKFNCCKFANFFADSKSRAQELSNDVSFVIFGHQTWDLERGGQIEIIYIIKLIRRSFIVYKKLNYLFLVHLILHNIQSLAS